MSQFKKLVANLPFNPSSLEDVAAYSDGLRGRAAARSIGLMFLVLGLLLQVGIAYLVQDSGNSGTGLAAVLAIGLFVIAIEAFLSWRERIMALELEILRLNYLSAGGA